MRNRASSVGKLISFPHAYFLPFFPSVGVSVFGEPVPEKLVHIHYRSVVHLGKNARSCQ